LRSAQKDRLWLKRVAAGRAAKKLKEKKMHVATSCDDIISFLQEVLSEVMKGPELEKL
jgi:hypothetical protein